jgi:hypothetical protein
MFQVGAIVDSFGRVDVYQGLAYWLVCAIIVRIAIYMYVCELPDRAELPYT